MIRLTHYGDFPIMTDMETKFDDYLRTSKRANSPEVREVAAVFERAYTIAMQVAQLRQKRGLTQKRLAKLSGIPQSEISRIERGSVHPTERTLVRLADALDADLALIERKRQGKQQVPVLADSLKQR